MPVFVGVRGCVGCGYEIVKRSGALLSLRVWSRRGKKSKKSAIDDRGVRKIVQAGNFAVILFVIR